MDLDRSRRHMIFAFILIGCSVSTIWGLSSNQQAVAPPSNTTHEKISCDDEKNFNQCFKVLSIGNGSTPDHYDYTQTVMTGPSGKAVIYRSVYFPSEERARQEFDDRLKLSKAVEKHTDSKDNVFALIDAQDAKNPDRITLIETMGKTFRTIESASPQDIRILANQIEQRLKAASTSTLNR